MQWARARSIALRCRVRLQHRKDAIEVRIETFQSMHVACIREVGPLSNVRLCLRRLFSWAGSVGAPTGRVLTLSFQRVDAPPGQRWYWKAAVELHTRERPPLGIELEALGAGRHAVHRLVGPYEGIGEAYRRLFEDWLPESGESAAERPCMELYRNSPAETVATRLITDLCIPLQEPPSG